MAPADTLLGTWQRELTEQPEGWDFAALDGRMREEPPPWDFDAVCREEIERSRHLLDMGTGGGEQLLRFADRLPPDTVATEGWPPNVPVAARILQPHGIPVVDWDADRCPAEPMPFDDRRFDLVLNRHEAYGVPEVVRVLLRGGVFLTQQVGSDDARETAEWFGGTSTRRSDWFLTHGRAEVEVGGLVVERAEQWGGAYEFADVAALMRYFSIVPWEVTEGLTVDALAVTIMRLHRVAEAGWPLRPATSRWWLPARRS